MNTEINLNEIRTNIILETVNVEGGYVDHADDSGGKTRYGITQAVAEDHGYSVKHLTVAQAVDIYHRSYWDSLKLDEIAILSELIAKELFDTGVNMHPHRSGEFLQRLLNVLNQKGRFYPDLIVDGKIGKKTINALKAFLNRRGKEGETVLFNMLNTLQGNFYFKLAERREKDESFIYGWFNNRVNLT